MTLDDEIYQERERAEQQELSQHGLRGIDKLRYQCSEVEQRFGICHFDDEASREGALCALSGLAFAIDFERSDRAEDGLET